jgi:hypothetical protein
VSSWQQEDDPGSEEGGLGGVDDEDLDGGSSGPAVEMDDEDLGGTGDEAS